MRKLELKRLAKGLPGFTPVFGACLAEAGAVCFESQNHQNGVKLRVNGTFTAIYNVYWQKVTAQMRRCWNDYEVTTEQAAYGVAILLICDLTEYTVIRRSRKGTGFDFWLGKEDEDDFRLEGKACMEVSGIRRGDDSHIRARVQKKLEQIKQSDSLGLPAYVVVVEFSKPLSQVVKK